MVELRLHDSFNELPQGYRDVLEAASQRSFFYSVAWFELENVKARACSGQAANHLSDLCGTRFLDGQHRVELKRVEVGETASRPLPAKPLRRAVAADEDGRGSLGVMVVV